MLYKTYRKIYLSIGFVQQVLCCPARARVIVAPDQQVQQTSRSSHVVSIAVVAFETRYRFTIIAVTSALGAMSLTPIRHI